MGFDLSNATGNVPVTLGFLFSSVRTSSLFFILLLLNSPSSLLLLLLLQIIFNSFLNSPLNSPLNFQIGWIITFSGLISAQVSIAGPFAPFWWTLLLTFFIIILVSISLLRGNLIRHRSMVFSPFPDFFFLFPRAIKILQKQLSFFFFFLTFSHSLLLSFLPWLLACGLCCLGSLPVDNLPG